MTLGITDDSNYTNIANAIRSVSASGTSQTMTPAEMASAIQALKATWGHIDGDISDQTDLQNVLDAMIDDTAEAGDYDVAWSAGKTYNEVTDLKNSYIFPSDRALHNNAKKNIDFSPITNDMIDITDDNGNILASFSDQGHFKVKEVDASNTVLTPNLISAHPIYSTKYDFAIQDESGNLAFAFVDGVAITNYHLCGKKLSIIGDSISTYEGYIPEGYATYYPHGEMNNVEYTWWWKLCNELGLQLLKNASWSGSDVTPRGSDTSDGNSAKPGCSNKRINDIAGDNDEAPDIIICFIGSNDWAHSVTVGSFSDTDEIPAEGGANDLDFCKAYALMLYKIRNKYPNAAVYCVSPLRGRILSADTTYPVLNTKGDSLYAFSKAVTEIADMFCCRVIDMDSCGLNYWNVDTYTVDSKTHPNIAGANILKDVIKRALISTYMTY